MSVTTISLLAIGDDQIRECYSFAEASYSSSLDKYSRRNQSNHDKIKNDIYLGKVAEYAMYNYYVSRGFKVSVPDVEVYDARGKSFDADLTLYSDMDYKIHVKSHFIGSVFPTSWVFQKEDPLVKHPKEYDIIALCNINSVGQGECIIDRALNMGGLYRPLMKKSLASKTSIYLEDLCNIKDA